MAICTREDIYTPNNGLRFLCLIKELCKPTDTPIFTIRDEKSGLISLRTLFLKLVTDDPSEATFAEEVFGDIGYWLKVRDNNHLKPFVEDWRLECDVLRKAKAFKAIMEEITSEGKSSFAASKFIIDEPWKDKRVSKNKADNKATSERAAEYFKEDLDRLTEEGFLN